MEVKNLTDEEIETIISRGPVFVKYLDSIYVEALKLSQGKTVKHYKDICITAARLFINNTIV